ncbi:reverse transcriptase domain-containing protein [Tanacetum coccineum]|uniref:Reverse transcriptase domain-containing protein n=1 Tax=Tanacetum coccineum TaxID=301880 RepID=A0ABQ5D7P6_9ASTR
MVPDSEKMIEVFIGGLPRSMEGNVTASKPKTLEEAINIAQRLMDQETFKAYAATPIEFNGYTGNRPLYKKCTLHHTGPCTIKCNICNKVGHLTKNCRNKGPATGSNLLPVTVTCHACGEKGHYANQCQKTTTNNAQGKAYMLRDRNSHQNPNVVTRATSCSSGAPYRLAPSEMQELSNQLQELADRGLHVDPAKIEAVRIGHLLPHPQKYANSLGTCWSGAGVNAKRVKETDIQEKDKNKAKNDKTEHENEKSVKKSQSQSQQSQPRQSQGQQSKSKSTPRS